MRYETKKIFLMFAITIALLPAHYILYGRPLHWSRCIGVNLMRENGLITDEQYDYYVGDEILTVGEGRELDDIRKEHEEKSF